MIDPSDQSFWSRHSLSLIGMHVNFDGGLHCGPPIHLHLDPVVLDEHGYVDLGVLGVMLDFGASQAGLGPFLHADMAITRLKPPAGARLQFKFEQMRRGKRSATVRLQVVDETGVVVATSTQQLAIPPVDSTPAGDVKSDHGDIIDRIVARLDGSVRLERPLHDTVGVRTSDNTATVELNDMTRNAFTGLYGGVTFSLVGRAVAQTVPGADIAHALLRFMAAPQVGPFRAVAEPLSDDYVQVDVFDDGQDGKHVIAADVHLR